MNKYLYILISVLVLTSCGSIQYVANRDVPMNPSVTVMTTYGISKDLGYASALEEVLINMGISIVAPPARISTSKSLNSGKGGDKVAALSDSSMLAAQTEISAFSVKIIEEYKVFDKTSATYIVTVDSLNNSIKIMRKDTKEILAVLTGISSPKFNSRKIRDAFKALGFKVLDKK